MKIKTLLIVIVIVAIISVCLCVCLYKPHKYKDYSHFCYTREDGKYYHFVNGDQCEIEDDFTIEFWIPTKALDGFIPIEKVGK